MKNLITYFLILATFMGVDSLVFASEIVLNQIIFPNPLEIYGDDDLIKSGKIFEVLVNRISHTPFNLWSSLIFLFAIIHTFFASKITQIAKKLERTHAEKMRAEGKTDEEIELNSPVGTEIIHFLGEVEAIFGIWVLVLAGVTVSFYDWITFKNYIAYTVNYTEAMFVVVIMALASTKPIMQFSKKILGIFAGIGKHSPGAWWLSILTVAPLLGSLITEPAAMTIGAILLGEQFYRHSPSSKLAYATIGILFVNVSVGGTFTHFAAPPVLMVAAPWEWTLSFMAFNFGWKALLGIIISNMIYYITFKKEFNSLAVKEDVGEYVEYVKIDIDNSEIHTPTWITMVHISFMGWTVFNAHYPPLFIGGFLFFLGFAFATKKYQSYINLKPPMLVGFFLAGLVTHGGLQAWWIAPVLGSLGEIPLMISAILLTAFNDNAAITYLSTLVPDFSINAKYAVVAGAVTGGGLTVIANAPNPAGQSILSKYFTGGVNPAKLALGAMIPTIILGFCYMAIPQDLNDPQKAIVIEKKYTE